MKTRQQEIKCKNGNLIYEFKFIADRASRSQYANKDFEDIEMEYAAQEIALPEIGEIYRIGENQVRKCLAAKISGFRSKKVRIVFGKDIKRGAK